MKIDFLRPKFPKFHSIKDHFAMMYKDCVFSNNGKRVQSLESKMADMFEFDGDVITFANGTLALMMAFKFSGCKKALVPSFTFPATIQALIWAGIDYEYVDIDPKTWTVDIGDLESKIHSTKADLIVPVHSFGNPCDVQSIARLAVINNCKVIYDAAPAISSFVNINGKDSHVCNFGDASCFSLHATKALPAGEGGVVFIKDKVLGERLRRAANFGFDENRITHEQFGTNAKLSEIHAAFALSGLERLPFWQRERMDLVSRYKELLGDCVTFQDCGDSVSTFQVMGAMLGEDISGNRDSIISDLMDKYGIQCRKYYNPPMHKMKGFDRDYPLPGTDKVCNDIISLPLHLWLSFSDIEYVCDSFKKVCDLRR